MIAGFRAGSATVLLACEGNAELREHEFTGLSIDSLDNLIGLLDNGLVEIPKPAN